MTRALDGQRIDRLARQRQLTALQLGADVRTIDGAAERGGRRERALELQAPRGARRKEICRRRRVEHERAAELAGDEVRHHVAAHVRRAPPAPAPLAGVIAAVDVGDA